MGLKDYMSSIVIPWVCTFFVSFGFLKFLTPKCATLGLEVFCHPRVPTWVSQVFVTQRSPLSGRFYITKGPPWVWKILHHQGSPLGLEDVTSPRVSPWLFQVFSQRGFPLGFRRFCHQLSPLGFTSFFVTKESPLGFPSF